MKKILLVLFLGFLDIFAHPVSYTIELEVFYDETNKEAKIICQSNSKNKCGLYNINLLDENEKTSTDIKFPFLKEFIIIKVDKKPMKLDFYLREIPEHKYTKIF